MEDPGPRRKVSVGILSLVTGMEPASPWTWVHPTRPDTGFKTPAHNMVPWLCDGMRNPLRVWDVLFPKPRGYK